MGISKQLSLYGREFVGLCEGLGITPVVYGSLACFAYLKDADIPVNDIDFLVKESSFQEIMQANSRLVRARHELTDYHSVKFLRGDLKVSFDAVEHYLEGLIPKPISVAIDGFTFQIVDLETLKEVYRRGIATIPSKSKMYSDKLHLLRRLP